MMELILSAVRDIKEGKSSCIVIKDGKKVKSVLSRGVKPILEMLEDNCLQDATVVDKVVGRAAAFVMVQGGVKSCYAVNVSEGAVQVFVQFGIDFKYENISEHIVNRTGDGICPMEQAVVGITSPSEAILAINKKLSELSGK